MNIKDKLEVSTKKMNVLLNKSSLVELNYSKKGAYKNPKRGNEEMRISPISDLMFKTMFANKNNKEYVCKLISKLIDQDYDYLLENIEYYKNDVDKEEIYEPSRRVDLMLKLKNGSYIGIEMNNRSMTGRNFMYAIKTSETIENTSSDLKFDPIIEINFNNYSLKGIEDSINFYSIIDLDERNQDHSLIKVMYIEVYLPKIREKCYTV